MLRKNFFSALYYVHRYSNKICFTVKLETYSKYFLKRSLTTAVTNFNLNLSCSEDIQSYFHRYLLERPEYYTSICNMNHLRSVNDSDPEILKLLGRVVSSSSPKITLEDNLKKNFKSELNAFDVEELCRSIYFLSQLEISDQRNLYKDLLPVLENEIRTRKFSKEDHLKLIYVLNVTWTDKRSYLEYFKKKSWMKLSSKLHHLSPQQTVELFYCLNQNLAKYEHKFKILLGLNDMISEFNSEELGIIAFGLWKSSIVNSHPDINANLMKKTIKEIENIHPYSLFIISKVLKKFFIMPNIQHLLDFQEQMIPHLSKINPEILINISSIGFYLRTINFSFWKHLRNIFKEKIQDFKVSNVSRLLNVQVHFSIHDEELFNLIIKCLEAKGTTDKNNLVLSLSHLTHFGLFPKNLLDMVLTENLISDLMKRKVSQFLRFNLWYLICCLELEKPECHAKLFENISLSGFYKNTYNRFNNYRRRLNLFLSKAKVVLVELFGHDMVHITNCVPYSEIGCVMRFDKHLNAQPIPQEFKVSEKHCVKKAFKDDHFWIFIILCTKYDFLQDSDTICLSRQTQLRHLKLIGFHSVVLRREAFYEQLHIHEEKTYLKELINKSLKQVMSDNN